MTLSAVPPGPSHDAAAMAAGPGTAGATGPSFGLFVVLVALLTVVRLIGLRFSVVDLYFDESQYWAWAQDLAFGYFSKPPLIAWIIAAAEGVCGSGEACLRSPAPLFYFAMAVVIYVAARDLYGSRTAFWAGLTAALAPGITFSTRIISTDVPLLFFWSVALLAYLRLRRGGGWGWALLLAVAFGLGILAKYAMVYFLACAIIAGLIDRDSRALLRGAKLWTAVAIGALFFVPNLIWNLGHGLSTMVHTGSNIAGRGAVFDVEDAVEFIAAQFGVGGPVVFGTLLILAARVRAPFVTGDDRVMLAFSVPILAVIALLAFVTDAKANWAATAFVSAFIVTTAVLLRLNRPAWVGLGVGVGLFCQIALIAGDHFADRLTLPLEEARDVYEQTMGWQALGDEVTAQAAKTGARAIVARTRRDVASLIYYTRQSGVPVYAWPPEGGAPTDHFELTRPLTADAPEPVLAVGGCGARKEYRALFASIEDIGPFRVPSGPTSSRRYCLYLLSDRKP